MPLREVTDPAVLDELNSAPTLREVTDPDILAQLNTPQPPPPPPPPAPLTAGTPPPLPPPDAGIPASAPPVNAGKPASQRPNFRRLGGTSAAGIAGRAEGMPEPAAPALPLPRKQFTQTLQDAGLFGSATAAFSGAKDRGIRRNEAGEWDLPIMAPMSPEPTTFQRLGGAVTALAQKVGGRLDDAGPAIDKAGVRKVFEDFQKSNGLSDEDMVSLWSDLGSTFRPWGDGEQTRTLSDGTILPNPQDPVWLEPERAAGVIDGLDASDAEKARLRVALPRLADNLATAKLEGYEASAAAINQATAAGSLGTLGLTRAVAGRVVSPSEWADARKRKSDFGSPEFIRDYEREVIEPVGGVRSFIRGLFGKGVTGWNKLATTALGVVGLAGSDAAAQAAAAGSEAGNVINQGLPDTGLAGSVMEEVPSLIAQMLPGAMATRFTAALGFGARGAGAVGQATAGVMAGAQSAGMTYADLAGSGDPNAREKAIRAGVSTAIINSAFSMTGAGGVERAAARLGAEEAGEATLRTLFAAAREEGVGNMLRSKGLRDFARGVILSIGGEATEEGIDEFLQAFLTADPDTPMADAWANAVEAAKVGGVLGGGVDVATGLVAEAQVAAPDSAKAAADEVAQARVATAATTETLEDTGTPEGDVVGDFGITRQSNEPERRTEAGAESRPDVPRPESVPVSPEGEGVGQRGAGEVGGSDAPAQRRDAGVVGEKPDRGRELNDEAAADQAGLEQPAPVETVTPDGQSTPQVAPEPAAEGAAAPVETPSTPPTQPVTPSTTEQAVREAEARVAMQPVIEQMRQEVDAEAQKLRIADWKKQFVGNRWETTFANDVANRDWDKAGDLVDRGRVSPERAAEIVASARDANVMHAKLAEIGLQRIASTPPSQPAESGGSPGTAGVAPAAAPTTRVDSTEPSPVAPAAPTQRDTSKPEQMTPEEWAADDYKVAVERHLQRRGQDLGRDPADIRADLEKAEAAEAEALKAVTPFLTKDRKKVRQGKDEEVKPFQRAVADARSKKQDLEKELRTEEKLRWELDLERRPQSHRREIEQKAGNFVPVSAAAVDAYGITLPEGYVRQGDLYVFQPPATPTPQPDEAQGQRQGQGLQVAPEPAAPSPAGEGAATTASPYAPESRVALSVENDAGDMRYRITVPSDMAQGLDVGVLARNARQQENEDWVFDLGFHENARRAFERAYYLLDNYMGNYGTQRAGGEAHFKASNAIKEEVEKAFRPLVKKPLNDELAKKQANGKPAIWLDDQVITENGKYHFDTKGRLTKDQDLSKVGFEKNLDVIDRIIGGEGLSWGANEAAKARLAEIKSRRQAEAEELARVKQEQEAAERVEREQRARDVSAYEEALAAFDFPKGKRGEVVLRTNGGVEFRLPATVHGPLAVHREHTYGSKPGQWKVTHLASGLGLGLTFDRKADATEYARASLHADPSLANGTVGEENSRRLLPVAKYFGDPANAPVPWTSPTGSVSPPSGSSPSTVSPPSGETPSAETAAPTPEPPAAPDQDTGEEGTVPEVEEREYPEKGSPVTPAAFPSDPPLDDNAADANTHALRSGHDPILGAPSKGAPVMVPFSPAAVPNYGDPISAPEVIKSLEGVLKAVGSNAPIRVGRVSRRSALGLYHTRERMIRLRRANDTSVAAHETAHAMEDALWGTGHSFAKDPAVPAGVKRELLKLGKALYPGKNPPPGGWHSEGFAEFVRIYVEGGTPLVTTEAPATMAWFKAQALDPNPKVDAALASAQDAARRFREQGALERGRQGIAASPGKTARAVESGREFVRTIGTKMVDMGFAYDRLTKAVAENSGAPVAPGDNPWESYTARRLTHHAVVENWVHNGMTDFALNPTGVRGLKDIFAPVRGKMGDFMIYLWARRTIALAPSGRESGLSVDDAQEIIRVLDSPRFRLAAQGVYDWNDGVLEYAAQASPDYRTAVDTIRAKDPGQYIPLHREFKAFDERYSSLTGSYKGRALVQRLKGSSRRIKNPVESMIARASALVLKANQRFTLEQAIRMADKVPGLGNMIFEVPVDKLPAAARTVEDLLKTTLAEVRSSGKSPETEAALEAALDELDMADPAVAEALVTFFAQAQTPKMGENPVVPVFMDGRRRWFEVNRDMYEALGGMEMYRLPKVVDMTLGMTARGFRLGTTGLRAAFTLATNPVRDFSTLHLNSQSSAANKVVPVRLFATWMRTMVEELVNVSTDGAIRSEWSQLYDRLGIKMANQLAQDTDALRRAARRLDESALKRLGDIRNWIDFIRDLLQFPESAARITEMKLVARDKGWTPTMTLDVQTANALINAAKQVTTDFTAAGSVSRVVNQAVPFFNAQIQGPRAHIRAAKRAPAAFMMRAMLHTIQALAVWWTYKDEEWWIEMPASLKYGYTYIPFTGRDGTKELIRIPRSFEADGLFMAGAQALADSAYQSDPEAMQEWFGQFLSGFQPSLPPVFEDIYEQAKNEDIFFDRPIVPKSEESLPPEEQYNDYTSTLAIKLGEMTGTSPRRIEHSIRSYFGGLGGDVASVLGRGGKWFANTEKGDSPAEFPVYGTLFVREGASPQASKSIDKLYEVLDFATGIQRSRKIEETKQQRNARLLLNDAAEAVGYVSDVARMTKDRKQKQELYSIRAGIAREAVARYEANDANRREFAAWKRKWERQVKQAEKELSR